MTRQPLRESAGTLGSTARLRSVDLASGIVLADYPCDGPAAVEMKLTRAAAEFQHWIRVPIEERAARMRTLAARLREERESCAQLITAEMGKPIADSRSEIEKCASMCEYVAEHAGAWLAPEHVETGSGHSFVRFDPLGPVLAVMPWNFPFWLAIRSAAPNLMAGNVVLLKHASNVSGCALRIEQLFARAGFPQGTLSTLLIHTAAVEGIIRDPRVAAVQLTGSVAAGAAVAAVAGSEIKASVLELGGSDPFIVLADADLERALDAAVSSRTKNGGQSCNSAKRFIVAEPLYEQFLVGMRERLAALRVGDPQREETQIGPLAHPGAVERLQAQVAKSVALGARCLLGGRIPDGPGYFYPPTLLADVAVGMPVFREETFGPVAPVTAASDVDHAIELANASDFGLGASIWTDPARGEELAPTIEAGFVAINATVSSDPRLPFGGVKRSGYGREMSRHGLLEFVNVKSVLVA